MTADKECPHCKETLLSTHRRDMKFCSCGISVLDRETGTWHYEQPYCCAPDPLGPCEEASQGGQELSP